MFADSKANYEPSNVAPLIESFAVMLGKQRTELMFQYENAAKDEVLEVTHPNDKTYLDDYLAAHDTKSAALTRYEIAARKSARLLAFQDSSPAGIKYFQER